jgi:hypothetical protein
MTDKERSDKGWVKGRGGMCEMSEGRSERMEKREK